MKVALITDAMWLVQEAATLRLLAVGLVDEGTGVVRVAPGTPEDQLNDQLSMAGKLLTYRPSTWRRLRDWNLHRLADPLREQGVDVIHALDASLFGVAIRLGATLEVPVVCNAWSAFNAEHIDRHTGQSPVAVVAPTQRIAEVLRRRLGGDIAIRVVAPGVYSSTDPTPEPLRNPDATLSIVVVTNGSLTPQVHDLMRAMAEVRQHLPQAMYFFYSVDQPDQHSIWQAARRLNLLEQISLVPNDPSGHNLMVQADVLLQPQATGLMRTLLLEAMATSRPVVAAPDSVLEEVLTPESAMLVNDGSVESWHRILLSLVADPDPFVEVGRSAHTFVKEHHSPSKFVAGLREVYEQVAAPEPLQFGA
ncbi:MAG: glycosyltransferase [Phycisphaera sp.]|nr:glycosyltransferase [Phycisphaera sp.]